MLSFLPKGTLYYIVFQRPAFWVWTLKHWLWNWDLKVSKHVSMCGTPKNIIIQKTSPVFLTPDQQYNTSGQPDPLWDV